jgi:hypothetical protein
LEISFFSSSKEYFLAIELQRSRSSCNIAEVVHDCYVDLAIGLWKYEALAAFQTL